MIDGKASILPQFKYHKLDNGEVENVIDFSSFKERYEDAYYEEVKERSFKSDSSLTMYQKLGSCEIVQKIIGNGNLSAVDSSTPISILRKGYDFFSFRSNNKRKVTFNSRVESKY